MKDSPQPANRWRYDAAFRSEALCLASESRSVEYKRTNTKSNVLLMYPFTTSHTFVVVTKPIIIGFIRGFLAILPLLNAAVVWQQRKRKMPLRSPSTN